MTNTPFKHYKREEILDNYDELSIWEFLLGQKVELDERFTNPFREDRKPGCFLKHGDYKKGILLMDYGDRRFHGMNCFDAGVYLYGSFQQFCNKLVQNVTKSDVIVKRERREIIQKKIRIKPINKNQNGIKDYWAQRSLYFQYYIDNTVEAFEDYYINSALDVGKEIRLTASVKPAYCFYVNRQNGICKLYQPYATGADKWYTNATNQIVTASTSRHSKTLIITEGKKEQMHLLSIFRTAKCDKIDVAWSQNAKMLPTNEFILSCNKYDHVIIMYDPDPAGVKGANDFAKYANQMAYEHEIDTKFLVYIPKLLDHDIDQYIANMYQSAPHMITRDFKHHMLVDIFKTDIFVGDKEASKLFNKIL